MRKHSLITIAAVVAALALASCNKEIEYNSNTGHDGSRDSASQLLVNDGKADNTKVDDISAPDGDNEDWFYFMPPEDGLVTVNAYVDQPQKIIMTITVMDSFGRPIHSIETNKSDNVYSFPQIEVKPERHFISFVTRDGKSSYSVRADFELPPVIEEPPAPVIDDTPQVSGPKPSPKPCVPADKCRPGQKCCKAKAAPEEEDEAVPEKTVKGTIVLITPRGNDLADIKINGIGSKNNVKKGAKAYLRGLKRKVDIYDCKTNFCMATVKANSDELAQHDTVDVVVP
ncbi:MAG: hypothetical protein IJM59_09940 [Proteobacteria bacterium]|nr:hypothetical protein [Pseudomonadota bacterium]